VNPKLRHGSAGEIRRSAFTLIELLVVVAVIGILAGLVLPSLARAKEKGKSIFCLNNQRQLQLAWTVYADENNDLLAHNLGGTETKRMLATNGLWNWASSLMTWELDSENTNLILNTHSELGAYVAKHPEVFRCPSDGALSAEQKAAGWARRSRSISMNAMVGDAGEITHSGANTNNPTYRQFLKLSEFTRTSDIFVFIEEHPDSINDGYFLNKFYYPEWMDLPASYHNGGVNLSFADGHVESHRWTCNSTLKPARPREAHLPIELEDPNDRADFYWLMKRTSVYDPALHATAAQ
jgi:prepilin-type N-terminal cleavage/methylation domain-containing protein/prepilin-type processing-associated H-X9-DG protein